MRRMRTMGCAGGVLAALLGACGTDDAGEPEDVLVLEQNAASPTYTSMAIDARGYKVDGQYRYLRGGTVQWFKLPPEVWEDRLDRFKAAGFNTIDMYVAWNLHEPEEGRFDFDTHDIRAFLALAKKKGLYVYLRPGPYITNEMDGGGVPAWVFAKTSKKNKNADQAINLRTNDSDYLAASTKYLHALNEVIKPYLISNGGPIILYGVENEYNWFEQFHNVDKLFWYNGGPERNVLENPDTHGYFSALRDAVRRDGVDVPITTCPGAGAVEGMGDVAGIVPMPNIYTPDHPEKTAYDVVTSMHDPNRFRGNYTKFPSGTTETDRSPAKMKRLFMGGMDGFFAFNVAGSHQEGYLNALVMNNAGPQSMFDFNWDKVKGAFLSPTIGYFHNVVDYYGAIGPSGTLREKFFAFRRANMFYDTFEGKLAPQLHPLRSGRGVEGGDGRVAVDHGEIGAREGDKRVTYWFDAGQSNYFIGLVNETGRPQRIEREAIHIDGMRIPRFAPIDLEPEKYPGLASEAGIESHADAILVTGLRLQPKLRLKYTTSEVLTARKVNGANLLVVYGAKGSAGELVLDDLAGTPTIQRNDEGIRVEEKSDGHLAVSYTHEGNRLLSIKTPGGEVLNVLVTTTDNAGKYWFFSRGTSDYLVGGLDYLSQSSTCDGALCLSYEQASEGADVFMMSPRAITIDGFTPSGVYDPVAGTSVHSARAAAPFPALPALTGKSSRDVEEAQLSFDDASWKAWSGDPQTLERLGINGGHAWYRAEVNLDREPSASADLNLYVEHASDIIGVYANGHYVTTLAPLGTEIDGKSGEASYRFSNLAPYLRAGRNVIAFRTEVWGHGSFMWPRGKLIGTKASLPSVGFDAEKGLWGSAHVGANALTKWKVRPGLGGERRGFAKPALDDATWPAMAVPSTLPRGDVIWYRAKLRASDLPDPSRFFAPVALSLKGRNAKATVFLNGRLIGRWLSDDGWLNRGTWARGIRGMWMNTDPDHFPIERSMLHGDDNVIAIAFEDASGHEGEGGRIEDISLKYNQEERGTDGQTPVRVPVRTRRGTFTAR